MTNNRKQQQNKCALCGTFIREEREEWSLKPHDQQKYCLLSARLILDKNNLYEIRKVRYEMLRPLCVRFLCLGFVT
jgi:hypothetical protein